MPEITGGCLCGKVRYSTSAEPVFAAACHCHDCQKSTGSAFAVGIGFPKDALSVQGELKTYHGRGDSGREVVRQFCPHCGSNVITEVEAAPGMSIVQGGTFDDADRVRPSMEIYCTSAQPWVALGGDLKRFPRYPQ